ncbi:MAG: ATP-binding cassette domain-containing protein [Ignavibacteriales bacterium]|nr:ATP-binding cassette domain-containing protein [Ignavibacteriales bacterium]MCF8314951.1 ATP-binding cassette domain-containing protein [Ignavibacteriales bacterium]MCF8436100.1 ATP-binding cassette domain-containing protein [Ignavibacteriales bacterium]
MENDIIRLISVGYSSYEGKTAFIKKRSDLLRDISFSVMRSETLGITGRSGSGKTTLAKLLVGLLVPSAGKIDYFGMDFEQKYSPIQLLFQNSEELLNPERNVYDLLTDSFIFKSKTFDYSKEIDILLNTFEIDRGSLSKQASELSGGLRQRIAMARLFAIKPEIMILDEPFSAQDTASKLNLFNLIVRLRSKFKITFIVISHQTEYLEKLCDRVLILKDNTVLT